MKQLDIDLNFKLPIFLRQAWVSDIARTVWQERIASIIRRWPRIERASVAARLRPCAFVSFTAGELKYMHQEAASDNLVCLVLSKNTEGKIASVIGSSLDTEAFKQAWQRQDHIQMGQLLGYPKCCCHFYQNVLTEEKLIDTIWPMAINTKNAIQKEVNGQTAGFYEIHYPVGTNTLLHRLGIKSVPHLPCAFNCQETIYQSQQYLELGRKIGFREDMKWLENILSWPMSWSTLHGISEVKTPVFKLSMNNDATSKKYIVHLLGENYPEAGGKGINFPYRKKE